MAKYEQRDITELKVKTRDYEDDVELGTWNIHKRPRPRPEPMGKNSQVVERAGYIPAKRQIQNLIASGEKLEEYRKRMYSNEPTPDDVEASRVMRKDYEVFDAMDDAKELGKKAKNFIELQKKASEDAAQAEKLLAEEQRKELEKSKQSEKTDAGEKPGAGPVSS